MTITEGRTRLREWVVLGVFCAFFFFYRLDAFGLVGADEPRYAQIAREMLARHDWVTPTLYGRVWLEKPVLYYWCAMLSYRAFGVSDWSARIPVAFLAALMIAALYLFMRRLRPGTQLHAALLACSCAAIFSFARAGSTDMPLAVCFTIGLLAWLGWFQTRDKRWLLVFYFCIAGGMLAKGPIAPLLAALIIVSFALVRRDARLVLQTLSVPGILVFLVTAMPWYVLVQLRNPQFFTEFILRQNLARFGTNLYHHEEPFWYFLPVLLVGLLPWTVFALAAWVRVIRSWRRPAAKEAASADDLEMFLAVWAVVPIIFFSLSKSKLPGYIIPAIPAWILLTSLYFAHQSATGVRNYISWVAHAFGLSGCVALAFLAPWILLYPYAMPPAGAYRGPLIAAAMLAAILTALALWRGWQALSASTLCVAVIATGILLKTAAPAIDAAHSARPVAFHLAGSKLPVAVFHVPRAIQYGLGFYLNREIPSYDAGNFPRQEHFLVTEKGDLRELMQFVQDRIKRVSPQCAGESLLRPETSFRSPVFDLYQVSGWPSCNEISTNGGVAVGRK